MTKVNKQKSFSEAVVETIPGQPLESSEIITAGTPTPALSPQAMALEKQFGPQALMFNDHLYERVMALAHVMSCGVATVPSHLRGNPSDCAAIIMQALRWNLDPYAVAQKTYFIRGILGYEAQLVMSLINQRAPIQGRLQFEYIGDWEALLHFARTANIERDNKNQIIPWPLELESQVAVRVFATLIGEETPREHLMYLSEAVVRNSPLWFSSPKQQLSYLAAKFWSRLYCPDVILGIYSSDELATTASNYGSQRQQVHPTQNNIRNVTPQQEQMRSMRNAPPSQPMFDLNMYLSSIQNAQNDNELKALGHDIQRLNLAEHDENRQILLQAYKSRSNTLKTQRQLCEANSIETLNTICVQIDDSFHQGLLSSQDYDLLITSCEQCRLRLSTP